MAATAYRGIGRDGMIFLESGSGLAEGTEVLVTPIETRPRSAQAILEAVRAVPPLDSETAEELCRLIDEGQLPVDWENSLDPDADEEEVRIWQPQYTGAS